MAVSGSSAKKRIRFSAFVPVPEANIAIFLVILNSLTNAHKRRKCAKNTNFILEKFVCTEKYSFLCSREIAKIKTNISIILIKNLELCLK